MGTPARIALPIQNSTVYNSDMCYRIDLRECVVAFVKERGRKSDAVRIFNVGRRTIYNWLSRPDLAPTVRGSHDRKLKKKELAAHVQSFVTLKKRRLSAGPTKLI
ncbi:MAG: hypothetical protein HQL91_04755 [Magnetococcales bacterium]|nr:hypothetical protein [Magnetococcales bacterium]